MRASYLIKNAILSEKSHSLMDRSTYTFLVTESANKEQIKRAVEDQFQVKVANVNVLKKSAKTKKIFRTRKTTTVQGGKKAIVTLQKGQSIALFSTKKEKTKVKKTETKADTSARNGQGREKKGLFSRLKRAKKDETK